MTTSPPPSAAAAAGARVQTKITIADSQHMVNLLGARDDILKLIERSLSSDIHVRGNEITISGTPADNALAERVFAELLELVQKGETLTVDAVRRVVGMLEQGTEERPAEVLTLNILSRRGRTIRPKTIGQKRYVDAIDVHTIVFGIGPAGTGKTYLAMAKAVQALQAKQVNRIILTRPAVEAGERLGFLPGTLYDKIDPYLRPLYDALHDMLDPDSIPKLMTAGTIEVAPLAYMRGRAQPLTAKVLTPDGWRPIGDLAVGDLVVGSDGLPTPVLGVYPQGRRPVYRVTTQDGASTLACGEHLWTVRTPDDRSHGRPSRVLQTQEMIGQLRRGHVHRYELPLVDPVEFVPQEVPIDPYALGLLLGDDCLTTSTTPSFSTADPELAQALEAALPGIELYRETESVMDVALLHRLLARRDLRLGRRHRELPRRAFRPLGSPGCRGPAGMAPPVTARRARLAGLRNRSELALDLPVRPRGHRESRHPGGVHRGSQQHQYAGRHRSLRPQRRGDLGVSQRGLARRRRGDGADPARAGR